MITALDDDGWDDPDDQAVITRLEQERLQRGDPTAGIPSPGGDVVHLDRRGVAHLDRQHGDTTSIEERWTDLGNARRLVARWGHLHRYVPAWAAWMAWDGTRWARDDHGAVILHAKQVARSLLDEAASIDNNSTRKVATKWAIASESVQRIDAMVKLARTEPGISLSPDQFDADPWALNCANGILDLRTGRLCPHDAGRYCTKMVKVAFGPRAEAPVWRAFLEQVLPDPHVRELFARAIGYSATGSVAEQKIFIPFGVGANGKTTALEACRRVLGSYAAQADPELMLASDRGDHPARFAVLQGSRFVLTTEVDEGRRLAEATVKRLTGGDRITARRMYADWFEFDPTWSLWMATNHRPRVRGTDHGIWRRLRIIPFDVIIATRTRTQTSWPSSTPSRPASCDGSSKGVVAGNATA